MNARHCIALGLILTCVLAASLAAWACSCIGPSGLDILSNNAAVFSGRATTVDYFEPNREGAEPPIRVWFEVQQVWKGPVRKTAVVDTVYNGFTCRGYQFKEGQSYLVAATKVTRDAEESDTVELTGIGLCGGTSLLSEASHNLTEFGHGQQP